MGTRVSGDKRERRQEGAMAKGSSEKASESDYENSFLGI